MPRTLADDEEKTIEEELVRPFYAYDQILSRRVQHFYISGAIQEPCFYVDLVHKIQTALPDEVIYIHLNTIGGNIATGIQIINAMQASPAHVICSLESEASSLGTLIFLAADEFIVHDNCLMMFHNYSGWIGGKGHEQAAMFDATKKMFEGIARRLYIPFLSENELERIFNGADIYIHSDEIRDRLQYMVKMMEENLKPKKKAVKKKVTKKKAVKKKAARRSPKKS